MDERSVLFACDLDSQVFGALPLALAFAARGWRATFAIESSRTLPQVVLERLAGRFELIERPIGALPTDDEAFRHDAIGVFVTGSRLCLFRHALEIAAFVKGRPRPALFCGFNGLVFEKFEEGVAWRLGYDVIGLNGPRDRDAFVDFVQGSDFARQPSVIVGLRRKPDVPQRPLKMPAAEASLALAETPPKTHGPSAEDGDPPSLVGDGPPETDQADPTRPDGSPAQVRPDDGSFDTENEDAPFDDDLGEDETTSEEGEAPEAEPDADDGSASGNDGEAALESESADNGERHASPLADGEAPRAPKKLFVFAEQVVVPRSPAERQSLVTTLARLAKASPGWDVALKARVRPSEKTFHTQPTHVEKLVKGLKAKPRNFFVTYKPLDELLERADLFATISSTALFDAFDFGVPSMVATDFGLRNSDGAHVFFSSGLLVRLSDLSSLEDAPIHAPDQRWLRRMGYGHPYSPSALVDWLESHDASRPMPRPFVTFPAAARVASSSAARAKEACAAWDKLQELIAAEDLPPEERRSAGQAGLIRLGSAITAALAPTAPAAPAPRASKTPAPKKSAPPQEGPVAAFSRRLGMYWFYKRTRQRLGLPVP